MSQKLLKFVIQKGNVNKGTQMPKILQISASKSNLITNQDISNPDNDYNFCGGSVANSSSIIYNLPIKAKAMSTAISKHFLRILSV